MFVGFGVRVAVGSGVELGARVGVRVGLAVMLDRGVAVGDCPAGSVAGRLNAQAEAHSAKLASTVRITRLFLRATPQRKACRCGSSQAFNSFASSHSATLAGADRLTRLILSRHPTAQHLPVRIASRVYFFRVIPHALRFCEIQLLQFPTLIGEGLKQIGESRSEPPTGAL